VAWTTFCRQDASATDIRAMEVDALLRLVIRRPSVAAVTRRCRACEHHFLSPTFDGEELDRLYSAEFVEEMERRYRGGAARDGLSHEARAGGGDDALARELIAESRDYRPRFLRAYVDRHGGAPEGVLDLGGADGNNVSAFVADGRRVGVFDVNPSPRLAAGVEAITDLGEAVRAGPWDLLVSTHTLEHLPEPARELESYRGLAADHALFYVEVPLEHVHARLRRAWPLTWHVNLFCRESLRRLMAGSGWRPMALERRVMPFNELRKPVLVGLFRRGDGGRRRGGLHRRLELLGDLAQVARLALRRRLSRRPLPLPPL
jgi:hypothetical protein